jgi:general stress protein YciG
MEIDNLNRLIYEFGLFQEVDDCIISRRVLTEVEIFVENGKRMAEIGRKGGQASAKARGQAYAKAHGSTDGEADGQQNKKKKIKENRKNKDCALSGDGTDKPWDQTSPVYDF